MNCAMAMNLIQTSRTATFEKARNDAFPLLHRNRFLALLLPSMA
jgi:hypothetical protein